MGSYWSQEEIKELSNDVYTLQDEEEERRIIDDYMDKEINNKNFWYWGFIDDLITNKMLEHNKDDLPNKERTEA